MELPIAKINKYSELDDISKVKRERDVLSEGYVPTDLRDIQYMNPEVIAQYLTRPNPNLPRYADDFEEFDPIVPATMLRDDVSTVLKEARLNLTRE
jgi:DNA primase large subunit